MKAENCKLSGTEEEFSLSSWLVDEREQHREKISKSSHKTNRAPAPKKQASKPPQEQSREVSEKHTRRKIPKKKEEIHFLEIYFEAKEFSVLFISQSSMRLVQFELTFPTRKSEWS